jgi:hypothetical protein
MLGPTMLNTLIMLGKALRTYEHGVAILAQSTLFVCIYLSVQLLVEYAVACG